MNQIKEEFEIKLRDKMLFLSGVGMGGGGVIIASTIDIEELRPMGYWLGSLLAIFGIVFNLIANVKPKDNNPGE